MHSELGLNILVCQVQDPQILSSNNFMQLIGSLVLYYSVKYIIKLVPPGFWAVWPESSIPIRV